jgi:hypothetical protein
MLNEIDLSELFPRPRPLRFITSLVSLSPRRLLVLSQTNQQLSHPLLPTSTSSASSPLPTQIDQLPNPLPARTPSSSIIPIRQKLIRLPLCLGNILLLLVVVVVVEIV